MTTRKPLISGNWKMNYTHLDAIAVVQKLTYTLLPADYDRAEDGRERYQRAAERIMAAIARLERPAPLVI